MSDGRRERGRGEEGGGETILSLLFFCPQSPLSLTSWDCVGEGEGVGVRWVPDHAATHCQNCSTAFSLIVRKHHCRWASSCTQVLFSYPTWFLYENTFIDGIYNLYAMSSCVLHTPSFPPFPLVSLPPLPPASLPPISTHHL